jgi:hypothetical protein
VRHLAQYELRVPAGGTQSGSGPHPNPATLKADAERDLTEPSLAWRGQKRDALFGTNTAQLKNSRAKTITDIPQVAKGADQGERGKSCKDNLDVVHARKAPPKR